MGNKEAIRYLLEEKGANVNLPVNGEGSGTVLHLAYYACHKEIVKILLEKKANINKKDIWLRTALHFLCEKKLKQNQIPDALQIIKLLVKYNVEINAKSRLGKTALDLAHKNAQQEIIGALKKMTS